MNLPASAGQSFRVGVVHARLIIGITEGRNLNGAFDSETEVNFGPSNSFPSVRPRI